MSKELDAALCRCVIAYQKYPFHTSSGFPFPYSVKKTKNGVYSGELVVSRKEENKILTRNAILLELHKVLEEIKTVEIMNVEGLLYKVLILSE